MMDKVFKTLGKLLVIMGILALPCISAAKTPDMHVVIFGDTGDESIGASVATDVSTYKMMTNELQKVLARDGVKTDLSTYTGSNCSRKKLDQFVDGFSCKDDIVLFIYNGHGARSHSDETKFPRMCLGSSYLSDWMKVSDLRSKLKAKQPRLLVIVTDCCNSYYDNARSPQEQAAMGSIPQSNGAGIRELFLNNKGDVCITAATPGQYGWCTQAGGYLTLNLSDALFSLDRQKGADLTWNDVLKTTSDKTYQQTYKYYQMGNISNYQRPVYDCNVSKSDISNVTDSNDDNNIVDNTDDTVVDNTDDDTDYDDDGYDDSGDEDYDYDDEYDDVPSSDHVKTGVSNFLIMTLIGLFFFAIPKWLKLDGGIGIIFKLVGVAIILYGIIKLFS